MTRIFRLQCSLYEDLYYNENFSVAKKLSSPLNSVFSLSQQLVTTKFHFKKGMNSTLTHLTAYRIQFEVDHVPFLWLEAFHIDMRNIARMA